MGCTTYVQFIFPGIDFVAPQEVENREFESLQVPPGAVGFQFYDIIRQPVTYQSVEIVLTSGPLTESPRYFFGYIYTAEMLADMVSGSDYLIEQMLEEGWEQVVLLTNSTWMPYDPRSEVILPPSLVNANMPSL